MNFGLQLPNFCSFRKLWDRFEHAFCEASAKQNLSLLKDDFANSTTNSIGNPRHLLNGIYHDKLKQ